MNERDFQDLLRYQNTLSREVVQEARTDKKIKLLNVINDLTGYGKRKVQIAVVVHQVESLGMSETEAYDLIDELAADHLVVEKDSYIAKSQ